MPEKHEENGWLDREEDSEDRQRVWWQVAECPKKCECSKASWDRVKCWSYESSDKTLNYVMNHLMESSLHNMTEEDAASALLDVVPEQYTETYKHRETYRRQVEKAAAKPTPRPPPTSPPRSIRAWHRSRSPRRCHSPRRRHSSRSPTARPYGKGKGKDMLDQLVTINDTVSRMPEELADLKSGRRSPARSSGARSSEPERYIVGARSSTRPGATRKIDMDAMVQVKKSLERASESCQRGHQFAQAMADQFKAEKDVIRGAYDTVDALITEYVMSSGL